ncbi:DUF2254 domain-containing protein [Dactylosporangium aurantiacum]|uniref:DUF2254 domain-containing protein n=1 Tax=Dactylosporangium aurantiacum TaxID=35754 RepID=A0A9Q9ITF2_9ACTN|nr:DUF2254 domain-containing protein [Dactylosporangium aurantiacum]MDG6110347.1 DUF2254 domain-containing protein [Dactylosporangium aurantiacum]UWZ58633.1 DUF2254 domain-containing protein [Dactylosporangium aurantiacum]
MPVGYGPDRRQRWSVLSDALRTQLWPLPAAGVALAIGLGVALPRLDAALAGRLPATFTAFLFSGGPEAARTVLSVIAGSLITVTSLTFSLTVVTLQLASSQFSPRLLRTFTQDRFVHGTLALLLATFTYAVTVLRTVRASLDSQAAFVPHMSVTVAYVLGLASVLGLVLFLAHLARQIRVESMMRAVHAETTATIRRVLPDGTDHEHQPPVPPPTAVRLCAAASGFLTFVDEKALLTAAADADAAILLDRLPGDSIIAGTPIAAAWAVGGGALEKPVVEALAPRVAAAVRVGFERTAAQDVAFGLRQLVDVAVKALSPGINDPTTAISALGHLAALLCEAAGHDLGPRVVHDEAGKACVMLQRPDLAVLLELAVAQPRRYGRADPDVLARLLTLLREVAWHTRTTAQRGAVEEQLQRLQATIDEQRFDDAERGRLDALARTVPAALVRQWPAS